VRDFQGKVQAAFCLPVNISVEPMLGEALAAFQMVEFCRIRGFIRIILEGDSLIVVKAINCTCENWSRYGNIIADIQAVLAGFLSWKTCHTKRKANSVAHILAQVGSHNTNQSTWIGCIPECIREVVLSESSSLIL
jgi:hypothetical protein